MTATFHHSSTCSCPSSSSGFIMWIFFTCVWWCLWMSSGTWMMKCVLQITMVEGWISTIHHKVLNSYRDRGIPLNIYCSCLPPPGEGMEDTSAIERTSARRRTWNRAARGKSSMATKVKSSYSTWIWRGTLNQSLRMVLLFRFLSIFPWINLKNVTSTKVKLFNSYNQPVNFMLFALKMNIIYILWTRLPPFLLNPERAKVRVLLVFSRQCYYKIRAQWNGETLSRTSSLRENFEQDLKMNRSCCVTSWGESV